MILPATWAKKVKIKKTFCSPESSSHWLDDCYKKYSILAILAKVAFKFATPAEIWVKCEPVGRFF